jgi:Holliday junction resolvasome RuvABC endonuclease subunit
MHYAGIDPGVVNMAAAKVEKHGKFLSSVQIATNPIKGDSSIIADWVRCEKLATELHRWLRSDTTIPVVIAVEGPAFMKFDKPIQKGFLHKIIYDVLIKCLSPACPIFIIIVPPSTLKKFVTGKGTANKVKMLEAILRRWPKVDSFGNQDQYEAFALAQFARTLAQGAMPKSVFTSKKARPPIFKAYNGTVSMAAVEEMHEHFRDNQVRSRPRLRRRHRG